MYVHSDCPTGGEEMRCRGARLTTHGGWFARTNVLSRSNAYAWMILQTFVCNVLGTAVSTRTGADIIFRLISHSRVIIFLFVAVRGTGGRPAISPTQAINKPQRKVAMPVHVY